MGQIIAVITKAILVTLVSSLAAICIEHIRRHNQDQNEAEWNQPRYDEHEDW